MLSTLTSSTLARLQETFSLATQSASAAMTRWASGRIHMALEELRDLPLEAVAGELGIGEELLTMVLLTLDAPASGQFLLTFDNQNGRQLASCVLNRELATGEEWTELEKSAVQETGNVVICAYVNELTRLLGEDLIPSPPLLIQDYGASVLEQALVEQAMASDSVLVCRTGFRLGEAELNWNLLFIPSPELLQSIDRAMGDT